MTNVKNVFKELGYVQEIHYTISTDISWIGYRKENFYLDDYLLIVFDCLEKGVRFESKNPDNIFIDAPTSKAIYQQMIELGWLNEQIH